MKLLPLLSLVLMTACSKGRESDDGVTLKDTGVTPDSGVAPDSGTNLGFNAREVAGEIAVAQCAYLTRCAPEYYDANATDE